MIFLDSVTYFQLINLDADKLRSDNYQLYCRLYSNGFIVETNLNEYDQILNIRKIVDSNDSELFLMINPTMDCNFSCWYCYETKVRNSKMSADVIKKLQAFISNTLNENKTIKKLSLSFFGGEPFLCFNDVIKPLLIYAVKNCSVNLSFTTNASLIDDDILSFFYDNRLSPQFQITLDGWSNTHNKVRFSNCLKDSYSLILSNIKKINEKKFNVRVRINYTANIIKDLHKIINDFEKLDIDKKYILFDFQRVWQDEKNDGVDTKVHSIMELFRVKGYMVSNKYSLNNLYDSCYADKYNSYVINYNGDIYKCTARDFTQNSREGYLSDNGNLVFENDSLNSRMKSKFKNSLCKVCKYFPVCLGGCSQQAIENYGNDYCIYPSDSQRKLLVDSLVDEILNGIGLK